MTREEAARKGASTATHEADGRSPAGRKGHPPVQEANLAESSKRRAVPLRQTLRVAQLVGTKPSRASHLHVNSFDVSNRNAGNGHTGVCGPEAQLESDFLSTGRLIMAAKRGSGLTT